MKAKIVFYAVLALYMASTFIGGVVLNERSIDKGKMLYAAMAPELRLKEFEALRKFSKVSAKSGKEYFVIQNRIEHLHHACERAMAEEHGETAQQAHDMLPIVGGGMGFGQDYANVLTRDVAMSDEYAQARQENEKSQDHLGNILSVPDPRIGKCFFLFYFGSMPLILIHYMIRFKGMGGSVRLELWSNPLLPLWVFAWPVGLFRYPRPASIKEQLICGYRMVVVVLNFALCFFAFGAKRAGAQEKDESDPSGAGKATLIHVSANTSSWSEYLAANGAVLHSAPVQQSSITVSFPKGFYFGLWDSMALGKRNLHPSFGNEVDTSVGWAGKTHGVNLNVDLTEIDVAPLGKYRGDVLKLLGGVGKDIKLTERQGIQPFATIEGITPVKRTTPHRGTWLREGVRYHWDKSRFGIGASASLFHDSGAVVFQPAYLAQATVGASVKLGKGFSLNLPSVKFSSPLTHVTDGRKTQFSFGGGVAFTF